MSKFKLSNTRGLVLFSRIQIVVLLVIAMFLKSCLVPAIICAVLLSLYSHRFEFEAWNGGKSEFGARWKWIGRAYVFDGHYREDVGFGAPRDGDEIILSHFRPGQEKWSLI